MSVAMKPGSGSDDVLAVADFVATSASANHVLRQRGTTLNKFGKPWNSTNVRPGNGGVRNHEAIVWNVDQIRVRYLCEFDGK